MSGAPPSSLGHLSPCRRDQKGATKKQGKRGQQRRISAALRGKKPKLSSLEDETDAFPGDAGSEIHDKLSMIGRLLERGIKEGGKGKAQVGTAIRGVLLRTLAFAEGKGRRKESPP